MARRIRQTAKPRGFPATLWDLLGLGQGPSPARSKPKPKPKSITKQRPLPSTPPARQPARPGSMQERYEAVTREMLRTYGVRVRKWRSSMSGVAWQVTYRDGSVSRLIEAPKPKGPMSAAIFLHEIGHHAIGFKTYTPRCYEEYKAWEWSINAMDEHGLNVTDRVHQRMRESLEYALAKARRRGLKQIPVELLDYFVRTERYSTITAPAARARLGLPTRPHEPSRAASVASGS